MVRIRVPAATAAAAVLALSACGSIHGLQGRPDDAGPGIDYVRFPPPPPMPTSPSLPENVRAGDAVAAELAHLNASLARLGDEIERSRSHLARLQADLERARARIDDLLKEAGTGGAAALPPGPPAGSRRPLVRVRYDHAADADHAEEVREAVWTALERLPDAVLDVVAVSPARAMSAASTTAAALGGDGVWLHAENVVASLVAMGIEPERLTLSAAVGDAAGADEVRIYLR